MRAPLSCLISPLPRSSGLPYVLAALVGFLASAPCSAATVPWRICEVYSNADGSSQFIQLCGGSDELPYSPESSLYNALLTASDGSSTQRFLIPKNVTGYYDSHRVLVATQGFANLNLIKPDFVMPNGFLPIPNGSISLANYDSVSYVGLPTDGFHAIDTDVAIRPGNGEPASAITLATAANFEFHAYGFSGPPSTHGAGGRWSRPAR